MKIQTKRECELCTDESGYQLLSRASGSGRLFDSVEVTLSYIRSNSRHDNYWAFQQNLPSPASRIFFSKKERIHGCLTSASQHQDTSLLCDARLGILRDPTFYSTTAILLVSLTVIVTCCHETFSVYNTEFCSFEPYRTMHRLTASLQYIFTASLRSRRNHGLPSINVSVHQRETRVCLASVHW